MLNLSAWKERVRAGWMNLSELPPPVKLVFVLLLLVLVTLCSGCATQSPPSNLPGNPQPPRLSEPIPTDSYSDKAQTLIESWRQHATGM
jgi:hypothetical protein